MKKHTILQVDDNLDMLLIGQRTFSAAGYDYLSARSYEEGVEKIKSTAIDLIILDYFLPHFNGLQFIYALTHEPDLIRPHMIPVVLLTAQPLIAEELQEYFHYGLRAVLHKPFGHRELVDVVDNILIQEQIFHHRATPTPPYSVAPLPRMKEDFSAALETIARLAAGLKESNCFVEEQYLDIDAIITASKRLLRLLQAHQTINRMKEPTINQP